MRCRKSYIQNLMVAYIFLWTISPPLFASDAARLLVVPATAVWFLIEITRQKGLLQNSIVPVLLALALILYTGIVEMLTSGPSGLLQHIQLWIALFFLMIFQSRQHDLKSLVPLFWLVLAVYPVWQIITVWTLSYEDHRAARIIVRASEAVSYTHLTLPTILRV